MTKAVVILGKDILAETRSREIAFSVLFFALLVVIVASFAFDPEEDTSGSIAPGVLWIAFTFAGVLGLNRIFAVEKEKGCLEGLLLCPVDRDTIYWGKMIAGLIFMLVVEVVVTPVFLILFDLPLFIPELMLITALATIGFVSVGTLFSAIAANARSRDILLPILFFPVVIPVIISAVKATEVAFDGKAFSDMVSWLQIMGAFDVIFLVVSALTFEFVVEE